jgi:uroporphyrin-III C-methyltransferase/precorrin-2 dehydrogenase/sirohydrochlorin ferrochelatase
MTGYPLLLDVGGRAAVVVGGGPIAARRAKALVDAGANVRIVAPWLCEDLSDMAAGGAVAWDERGYFGPEDLAGAWLVHTATGDADVDRRVSRDAEALGIWCVDAGDARRSAAHVPATARVETPDGPLTLAVSAGGDPRRAVALRDAAVSLLRGALASGRLPLRRHRTRPGAGWVALVGGGPGDVGLLTTRARELIAAADVVVTDRLGPRRVLDELDPGVEVVDVGKTPGHHPWPQHEINAELVRHALAGRGVVRLKGGDPYVLGRGSEERQVCEAAGVAVEVVPGITSAISVPAAAGIPVTHRGLSRGFTVMTGHEEIASLPTGSDHTLVLLMGVAGLRRSAAALVDAGRGRDCPVAVIEDGYGPGQRVTVGTLATIADVADAVGVRPPAVIVVGDVVTLSPSWPG